MEGQQTQAPQTQAPQHAESGATTAVATDGGAGGDGTAFHANGSLPVVRSSTSEISQVASASERAFDPASAKTTEIETANRALRAAADIVQHGLARLIDDAPAAYVPALRQLLAGISGHRNHDGPKLTAAQRLDQIQSARAELARPILLLSTTAPAWLQQQLLVPLAAREQSLRNDEDRGLLEKGVRAVVEKVGHVLGYVVGAGESQHPKDAPAQEQPAQDHPVPSAEPAPARFTGPKDPHEPARAYNKSHPAYVARFNAATNNACVAGGELDVDKVIAWQGEHHLEADGKVGHLTAMAAEKEHAQHTKPAVEPKVEPPKADPKVEPPRGEHPKVVPPKVDPKVEPQVEHPKIDPKPKVDPPKTKQDPAKPDSPVPAPPAPTNLDWISLVGKPEDKLTENEHKKLKEIAEHRDARIKAALTKLGGSRVSKVTKGNFAQNGGYQYAGKRDETISPKTDDRLLRLATIEIVGSAEHPSEGGTSSVNTYDGPGQVTFGSGWLSSINGANNAGHFISLWLGKDADARSALLEAGLGVCSDYKFAVVEDGGKIVTGNAALMHLQHSEELLNYVSGVMEQPESFAKAQEAQVDMNKSFHTDKLKKSMRDAMEHWTNDDAVRAAFHLGHWLPAAGPEANPNDFKATNGEALKLIHAFAKNLDANFHVVSPTNHAYVVGRLVEVVDRKTHKHSFVPHMLCAAQHNFKSWANGYLDKVARTAIAADVDVTTDEKLKNHVIFFDGTTHWDYGVQLIT